MSGRLRDKVRLFLNRNILSTLSGMRTGDWLRLLWEDRFGIDPRYWPRALFITAASLFNSFIRPIERWAYGARVQAVDLEPPLFILGHPAT